MFFEALSISTKSYQIRAQRIIEGFLEVKTSEKESKKERQPLAPRLITLRVRETPPSLQLILYPEGGILSGKKRVREKFFEPGGPHSLITVQERDLTRENIIVTLEDATLKKLFNYGLIAPPAVSKMLEEARKIEPKLFILLERFLIGIEKEDSQKIPFRLIEKADERSFRYLEENLQFIKN